eukprot:CAMPEP_0175045626 /NCGR_PEP_ID=MMETSP0052_2-20121109/4541_1 /TAXON_ID=51329 ORGANISM="Polytomella parva, Strain SAG 63-3" /NCGR_SAMPLE_ID=MMETSP0052_2 /ASSEMBLY_ACC=CAM_ASM_000194 /LENGTH=125 /DNA_ID=CAMNT_0016309205 /DNA_START=116 /DNA_END=490 /DNA_ORIENTATION=-
MFESLYSNLAGNDLNLNTGLDVAAGDLANSGNGSLEVENTLVDPHLEAIEGVGTLTRGTLAGGNLEDPGGHADGALGLNIVLLGGLDEVSGNLLKVLDALGGKGNANTVESNGLFNTDLSLVSVH